MRWSTKENLRLGSNTVELLLPQRRPFLMVDFVRFFSTDPVPALEGGRHVTANEEVFAGHFPGLHIWPGALTIEGLGQTGVLLLVLLALRRAAADRGEEPSAVLESLKNLDQCFRVQPGSRLEEASRVRTRLRELPSVIAVGTSVDVKFTRPVLAGCRLDYRVELTGEHAGGIRFDAEACVEGSVVAKGTLMGASVAIPAPCADP